MGLDIALISSLEEGKDFECHELSRTFCQLVCDLCDLEGRNPELRQLFGLLKVDLDPVLKMNVWDVDQHILSNSWLLTYEEIERRYEKAWRPADEMHALFTDLYRKIESDLSIFKQLQVNYDWVELKAYFENFNEDIVRHGVDKNFGWDLRLMIQSLEKLKEVSGAEVRFHFY